MIRNYRKKPVVIEAVQWDGTLERAHEIDEFTHNTITVSPVSNLIYIQTLEGVMEAQVGDFIIKGVKGEFYPCKPDIFEQTYEEIHDLRGISLDKQVEIIQKAIDDAFDNSKPTRGLRRTMNIIDDVPNEELDFSGLNDDDEDDELDFSGLNSD